MAVQKHVSKEFKQMLNYSETKKLLEGKEYIDLKINSNGLMFITEKGLYELLLYSRLKKAKKIRDKLLDIVFEIRNNHFLKIILIQISHAFIYSRTVSTKT